MGGLTGSPAAVQALTSPCVAVLILAPDVSLLYCHNITPAYQPNYLNARVVQAPKSVIDTNPEFITSICAAGFPTTILFDGMPLAIIYFTAVFEKNPVDLINSYSYVLYLVSPWLQNCTLQKSIIDPTYLSTVQYPPLG